jgi:hypothetical protein
MALTNITNAEVKLKLNEADFNNIKDDAFKLMLLRNISFHV